MPTHLRLCKKIFLVKGLKLFYYTFDFLFNLTYVQGYFNAGHFLFAFDSKLFFITVLSDTSASTDTRKSSHVIYKFANYEYGHGIKSQICNLQLCIPKRFPNTFDMHLQLAVRIVNVFFDHQRACSSMPCD